MNTENHVYVGIYRHRHGEDISVYASEALAEEARQHIAWQFWDELSDPLPMPEEPADTYFKERSREESFVIIELPVITELPDEREC